MRLQLPFILNTKSSSFPEISIIFMQNTSFLMKNSSFDTKTGCSSPFAMNFALTMMIFALKMMNCFVLQLPFRYLRKEDGLPLLAPGFVDYLKSDECFF